jgi:hypothetical protein
MVGCGALLKHEDLHQKITSGIKFSRAVMTNIKRGRLTCSQAFSCRSWRLDRVMRDGLELSQQLGWKPDPGSK